MTKSPKAVAITRRSLIGGLALAGVGTMAQAAPRTLGRAAAGRTDLSTAGAAEWRALVGERFSVAGLPGAPMRLVAVEPVASGGPRPSDVCRAEGFAAIFETGSGRAPEGDATYWLGHRSAAPMPVHLGLKAEVAGKAQLVAIFN